MKIIADKIVMFVYIIELVLNNSFLMFVTL